MSFFYDIEGTKVLANCGNEEEQKDVCCIFLDILEDHISKRNSG